MSQGGSPQRGMKYDLMCDRRLSGTVRLHGCLAGQITFFGINKGDAQRDAEHGRPEALAVGG